MGFDSHAVLLTPDDERGTPESTPVAGCYNGDGLKAFAKICQDRYDAAMGTMNISLPDGMREFVDGQVSERGYGTSSEYIRDLIRREQDRLQLRGLLLEGAAAPRTGEADAAYFDGLRARARKATAAPSAATKARARPVRRG